MPPSVPFEALARQLTDAFARVWGERLGGTAATAPSADLQGPGWLITLPLSGSTTGKATLWVEREAAAACTKTALAMDRPPEEPEIIAFLRDLVTTAAAAVAASSESTGIYWGEAAVRPGPAAPGLQASYLAIANTASCVVGVKVEPASTGAVDGRLDAVLDVDLPLVVRFGRAVMPLKAIADLGPGSVVDMGRSPEEPVELLVGERVIARGEVVVVSGNYGVRITELSGSRQASDMEARLS
jgi:flagellar motor switch protein FliN/FliY